MNDQFLMLEAKSLFITLNHAARSKEIIQISGAKFDAGVVRDIMSMHMRFSAENKIHEVVSIKLLARLTNRA